MKPTFKKNQLQQIHFKHIYVVVRVPTHSNSPRHSLPPSPPTSYDQDIGELRKVNARLHEQIDNLTVSFLLPYSTVGD